jgi:hypothetical protein
MSASGPSCVDAGVIGDCRLHVFLTQHLPHKFECARIRVEDDLGGEVPKLMWRDSHAQMLENGLLDGNGDGALHSPLSGPGDEHGVGSRAGYRRGDFVAVHLEALRERGRDFEFKLDAVLGFVGPDDQKGRRRAGCITAGRGPSAIRKAGRRR